MSEPDREPPEPRANENVTRLSVDGRELTLVGTAHVSKGSVEEVRRVIAELAPDAVCVELDAARCETLRDESRWQRLQVAPVLRANRAGLFLASLLFAGFQKRLGDRLGVRPGAEMLAAVEEAERRGAKVVLADRDIQATLARCYRALSILDRLKVSLLLAMLPFATMDIDESQVEELKSREAMGDAMEAFARQMPTLKTPLIDERDRYLAASIRAAEGRRIVAVVGAAHVGGIVRHIEERIDRDALAIHPSPSAVERLSPWAVPVLSIAVLGVAWLRSGSPEHWALTGVALVAPVVIACFLATLLVGGNLVAVLLATVLSPLSLLAPGLRPGQLAGLVQAKIAPPSADDRSRVRDDVLAPGKARKNRFLVPVLVAVGGTLGRRLGIAVGLVWALVRAIR